MFWLYIILMPYCLITRSSVQRFFTKSTRSAGLVETQSTNVRVDHAQIEWRHVQIAVGQGDKHSTVDDWVAGIHLHKKLASDIFEYDRNMQYRSIGLEGVSRVGTSHSQRSVCRVQLVD